jgi:hypothetical protein
MKPLVRSPRFAATVAMLATLSAVAPGTAEIPRPEEHERERTVKPVSPEIHGNVGSLAEILRKRHRANLKLKGGSPLSLPKKPMPTASPRTSTPVG